MINCYPFSLNREYYFKMNCEINMRRCIRPELKSFTTFKEKKTDNKTIVNQEKLYKGRFM